LPSKLRADGQIAVRRPSVIASAVKQSRSV
jgi:hypothetical protein